MENITPVRKRTTIIQLVLGGALIGGALFVSFNFASSYDQQNTHPALTDEAVDFYNLSFPNNLLTESDKKWLIKGAIDEDTAPRPLNHFYDPVYNQGWVGYTSSKIWAYSSEKQVAFFGGKSQTAGFAQFFVSDELSADDYSYQRALYDYAVGDRKRAMLAMGHIMHLLEDVNVPDHTRNDTHLPWGGTESPYEKTMAKWNPGNLDIAGRIFANGAKPIMSGGLGDYFDKISKYSNGHFFSEDTILSKRYTLPRKVSEKFIEEDGVKKRFAMGRDRNGELFPLFRIDSAQHWRNLTTETKFTINSPVALNDYWSRLSKDFVPLGAGALKLFLDQAEKVKREYPENQQAVQKPGAFDGVLGLLGISGQSEAQPVFDPALIDSILEGPAVTANDVSAPPTPFPTPLTPLTLLTPLPTPFATPLARLTPSPTPIPSPTLLAPSPTPSPNPLPTPAQRTSQFKKSGRAVINEVAWSGTMASAADEWIELYNAESEAIDMSGWLLKSDDNSPSIVFGEGTTIPANGYFLIERTDDNAISGINADLIASFGQGGLKDAGEVLFLYNSAGSLVDKVGISGLSWYAGGTSSKLSMERIEPLRQGDEQVNWKAFSGTPSARDAKGNLVNGTPRSQNSPVSIAMASGGGSSGSSSLPTPSPSSTPSPTPSATPTPSPTPKPGLPGSKVVINEIAWMGTATQSNDEWVELYNITNQPVVLDGWILKSETDGSPNITLIGTINAFEYFLLERTNDSTISNIAGDFVGSFGTGGLKNSGEKLSLKDAGGNLQDLVDCVKDETGACKNWHAGNIASKSSMERIDPTKAGDDSTNWATNNGITRNGHDAAGNPINGTPRARNSVYVNKSPSAVSDLAVDIVTSFFGNARLTWSAPRDDDDPQSNLKYELRYATRSFDTLANWESAAKVASSSIPSQVANYGQPQSSSFTIFDYNRDYYFAIKTCDKEACSEMSNQPKYTIKPAISDDPTAFRGPAGPATISWEFKLPAGFNVNQPGLARDGTIYFGSHNNFQGKLYAINPNGTEKWRLGGFSNRPPAFPIVADDGVVYSDADSLVYAVNPDMSIRWQYTGASGPVGKVSIDTDGNVMFTDTANIPVNDRVFKIKPDGTVKWNVFLLTASGFTPITGPDGDAYTSSRWGANGIPRYYRLNGDDGVVGWQVSPDTSSVYATSDLVYDQAENKLYAPGTSGFRIFTINPSDEQLTENERLTEDIIKPFAANPTTKVTISSDLLVVGATLISTNPASGSAVYGIDKATKSVRWTFPISASISVDPYNSMVNKEIIADVDGNFYFSTKDGRVYSLDKDGKMRWVLDLGAPTELYPVLGENAIFMGINTAGGGKLLKIADY